MDALNRESVERHLLRLLEGSELTPRLVAGISGDFALSPAEQAAVDRLRESRPHTFYADLLFMMTHELFAPEEAEWLWHSIVQHKEKLTATLGRNVGMAVATLDYLTNVRHMLGSPSVIRSRTMSTVAEVALKDGLTGLFVHSTFVTKLEGELVRCARYEDRLAVALIDIDNFKQINDTLGHARGDWVLAQVAAVMRLSTRETDVGGRYGGDEFALVMPRTGRPEAVAICERIRREVRGLGEGVSVSVGLAVFPADSTTAEGLLRRADDALYESKRGGKDRVAVAEAPGAGLSEAR